MQLSGEAYSKRLETFSHFTLVLIVTVDSMSREIVYKGHDITTDSELTEEQVIEKLIELIDSNPTQSPPASYEDALEIVCDALEQGCFASLYKILDKNATLIYVDDDKCITGIRDIINFLVKERLDHLYCSDEKTITCDILKVDKGERYGVGEKCILSIYLFENGEKEYHIIKVHFANGLINKLEVFHPFGPLQLVAEQEV